MADLAASDVTITVDERRRAFKERRHIVKIEFGDGAKTYPSGGVPMPSAGNFGLVRNLTLLSLVDNDDASGIVWKWDKDNNKLRGYKTGSVKAFTVKGSETASDETAFVSITEGDGTAQSGVAIGHAGGGADIDINTEDVNLSELASGTDTPAAQTLYAEVIGW